MRVYSIIVSFFCLLFYGYAPAKACPDLFVPCAEGMIDSHRSSDKMSQAIANVFASPGSLEEMFVTYWGWLKICNFTYMNPFSESPCKFNQTPFSPADVQVGNVIGVANYCLPEFFKQVHPYIKHPYILLSLYYGEITPAILDDPKIIAAFAISAPLVHKKIVQIPLGIMRETFVQREKLNKFFMKLRTNPKTKLAYLNFATQNWRERPAIKKHFMNKPFCTIATTRKPFVEFMTEMAEHKFVIAPRGDMVDTFRTWEAILVGSIPVVGTSVLDPLLADLPVVIVSDWNVVTEEFLNQKYQEISAKVYSLEKLFMPYWIKRIKQKRQEFIKQNSSKTLQCVSE